MLSGQTGVGEIVGTLTYLSPEQAEGKTVGPQSDIFSLGVVFYEMFCGTRPFRGDTMLAQVASTLREAPAPPGTLRPELPTAIARIILRCLEKNQKRGSSQRANCIANWQRVRSRRRRRISARSVGAVAALLLVIALGVAGSQAYFARRGRSGLRTKRCRKSPGSSMSRDCWQHGRCFNRPSSTLSDSPELIRLKARSTSGHGGGSARYRTERIFTFAITPTSNPVIHSGGGWAVHQ